MSSERTRSALKLLRVLLLGALVTGCRDAQETASPAGGAGSGVSAPPAGQPDPAAVLRAPPTVLPNPDLNEAGSGVVRAAQARATCPTAMVSVPGGEFWLGSVRGPDDEQPRTLTEMTAFCMDETEVTARAYGACVDAGQCTAAHGSRSTCNGHQPGRADHPINCVDWSQADAYCRAAGKRLPTEAEWEYAARGGKEARAYSWGSEDPDGRTCWKSPHSCPVKSFQPGAFGLHDMSGNVWEWTDTWYQAYPWPGVRGQHKVFRGGGWSRRFTKWMSPTLRNRSAPKEWGSHLGFRCALTLPDVTCVYGKEGAGCAAGVRQVECEDARESFNGVRCALPGARRCPEGTTETPGHGCVAPEPLPESGKGSEGGRASETESAGTVRQDRQQAEDAAVQRAPSPQFDADCRANQPARPVAYRFSDGTHAARNRVGKRLGCKNRDVGVGWNSACCPK